MKFMTLFISVSSFSQEINWAQLPIKQSHIININVGLEHGTVIGVGYGYQLNTKIPIIINAQFSKPFGYTFLDDFKTKLGIQSKVFSTNNFAVTIKAYGSFRRFESSTVRLSNFGSEFSTSIGFYKPKWFIAGEFGFDKAITTYIKNGKELKEYYPDIKDGWYVPTGGVFFYGIQSGYSFKANDLTLGIGVFSAQDFKSSTTLPYYLNIGYNKRL